MKYIVKIATITGLGFHCAQESSRAFQIAAQEIGREIKSEIIHINDLVEDPALLSRFDILVLPGGFTYGDYTGSGNALALKIKNNFAEEFQRLYSDPKKLIIGICNGCQILVRLIPEFSCIKLVNNDSKNYQCYWVDIEVPDSPSVWLKGLKRLHFPIAHGEGKFICQTEDELHPKIAATYLNNPNGSMLSTAAVTDSSGRILAIMPHPERAVLFTHRDDWTHLKEQLMREQKAIPKFADGINIFINGLKFF